MRIITTVLILILLYLNWYRYHIPLQNDDISLFDYYSAISFSLLALIAILKPRNIISEGFLMFTLFQSLESVFDELNRLASYIGRSDDNYLLFCIVIFIAYVINRYWLQKTLLKRYLKKLPII